MDRDGELPYFQHGHRRLENSRQLVHMELDLVEPIPKIRLRLYHEVLEYRPVSLPKSDTEFWLPSSAELYLDFIKAIDSIDATPM
jgi:hypothetical protein